MSKALERAFRRRGIASSLGVRFAGVDADRGCRHGDPRGRQDLRGGLPARRRGSRPGDRRPRIRGDGVTLDRGFVITDERLRTSAEHVWAVGDIVPGLQLAHRGFQQGIFVAEEIAGLRPVARPRRADPEGDLLHPEVASVGLTEAQAVEAHGADGGRRRTSTTSRATARARSSAPRDSSRSSARRTVPCSACTSSAIASASSSPKVSSPSGWEAHPEDIAPFIHAHPTQSEALGEAFLALAGKPLHAL